MRIRRRAAGGLPLVQDPSSPSCPPRSPPAPRAPSHAPASRSEAAAARGMEPRERDVDRTMCEWAGFDPGRASGGGNRQEEEVEESDKGTGNEKRGGEEEDGGSEDEHGRRPVHVVRSTPAAPKREGEEEPAEVEEKKSEESRRVREDEEKTAAAAVCKKGDGKGWHCKRAAQWGYSFCQHHVDKFRSYYSYSQAKKKKPKSGPASENSIAAGVAHRQGASQQKQENKRRVDERALSTVPGVSDSFYYYSGFGPRWGKRRRSRSGAAAAAANVNDGGASQEAHLPQHTGTAASAVAGEGGGGEGEYECDSGGRDGRPWKSRALSSLL